MQAKDSPGAKAEPKREKKQRHPPNDFSPFSLSFLPPNDLSEYVRKKNGTPQNSWTVANFMDFRETSEIPARVGQNIGKSID